MRTLEEIEKEIAAHWLREIVEAPYGVDAAECELARHALYWTLDGTHSVKHILAHLCELARKQKWVEE